jgi:ribosomal protein S12 methylthiotransferase accessory factor
VERLTLADVAPTPLARSLPILESLASPLTGIVPHTRRLLPATDDARWFRVASLGADSSRILGAAASRSGGGVHVTHDAALAAAIGEGLEQYAGAYCEEDRLRVASAADLGDAVPRPASFALFHPRQYAEPGFAFEPFTADTRIRWTAAFRLPDGEPCFVPAQLAHAGVVFHDEPRIGYATSSGMACGATLEEAILGGLLELVERDAFAIAWYNRLSLPLVDWSGDRAVADELRRFCEPAGVRYEVVDLTPVAGVPTALGLCRDAHGEVALAAGCASAPTMRDALRKAVREAFQTRAFGRRLRAELPEWHCADVAEIASLEDHALYYAQRANAAGAAFLDASPARVALGAVPPLCEGSVTDAIRALVRRLARAGTSVCVVDTTPPDLRAAGVRTAAVVAPELCRLDVPYRYRYLGGRRLYGAACAAGLAARPSSFDDLNPLPHPFA